MCRSGGNDNVPGQNNGGWLVDGGRNGTQAVPYGDMLELFVGNDLCVVPGDAANQDLAGILMSVQPLTSHLP